MSCKHRTPHGHAAFDGRLCMYCGRSALEVLDEWNRTLRAVRAEVMSVRGVHPDQLEQKVFAAFDRIAALAEEDVSSPANPSG